MEFVELFKVRISLVAREGRNEVVVQTQKRARIREMAKELGKEKRRMWTTVEEETGKDCERAGEERKMSSRGDLRSGAARLVL